MPAHERREFAAALEQMRRLVRRLEAELEGEYARPVVR
jgi:hypothetical protein